MEWLTQEQIKGMLDRAGAVIATLALGYLVRKGWIGDSEVAALTPILVLVPTLFWGWWVNRNKALVQSASTIPGTVVITNPEIANNVPQSNVISSSSAQAKRLKKAK
jgi:hypothetical protein